MSAPAWVNETQRGDELGRNLALMWPLLGRRIAFHRRLVDLTGSVKAAVLLSQMIYWTRHGRDIAVTDGWFHKTTAQWELETGLTAREQAGARDILCELGILNTRRRGAPAVLHFQLAAQGLVSLLAESMGHSAVLLDRADGAFVFELLGPPLAYHRTLAAIGGGVHAGLLLSRALYLTRYSSRRLAGGWFYASRSLWTDDIGLGRWAQEAARRQLVHCGVWDEYLKGIPPRLYVRVRKSALLALLTGQTIGAKQHGQGRSAVDFPGGGIPTIKKVGIPPSSRWDYCQQDSIKPAYQFQQNPPISFDNTSKINVHRSTRCLVQTPLPTPAHKAKGRTDAAAGPGGGDLILPRKLLLEERVAAAALVSRCPAHAQALLDELDARLQKNSIHTSPIAYLRGMVQRAQAGDFVPELAAGVSAARRRQAEAVLAREQRESEVQRRTAEEATPQFQQKVAERRVQVKQMLDAMHARNRSESPT